MRKLFFDGQGALRNGWKIAGYFLVTIVLAGGLAFCRSLLPGAARAFIPGPLPAFFGALIAAWILLRLEHAPLSSIGLDIDRRFGRELGLGLARGACLLGLLAILVWLSDGFHLEPSPGHVAAALVKGAWFFFAVAAAEEIIFRGYAFQRAIRGMGPFRAQLVFAILFAVMHLPNPGMSGSTLVLAMISIFMASLMLGFCYMRTGSLALPIGVHMGWNWAQATLGFAGSGIEQQGVWRPIYHAQPDWLTGGAFGLEASVPCIVLLFLVVLGLAQWKGVRRMEASRIAEPVLAVEPI
jgi:uncharacterized protein